MTSMERIITHNEFLELIKGIDAAVAKAGFSPKEHHVSIHHYHAKFANDRRGYNALGYWHTNVPIKNSDNMYEDYYMNNKRQTIHLSVKVAKNLTEKNVVHYGGNSESATKALQSFVSKLRRKAKEANTAIDEQADIYYATPHGINSKLEDIYYKTKDEWKSVLYEHNYKGIVEGSGGDSWRYVVEKNNWNDPLYADAIGKISWRNESYGYKKKHPERVRFSIFFEEPAVQKALEEASKELYTQLELHNEQVDLWEQEKVVRKLKGESKEKIENIPF